jgi:hypothetical protein
MEIYVVEWGLNVNCRCQRSGVSTFFSKELTLLSWEQKLLFNQKTKCNKVPAIPNQEGISSSLTNLIRTTWQLKCLIIWGKWELRVRFFCTWDMTNCLKNLKSWHEVRFATNSTRLWHDVAFWVGDEVWMRWIWP